MGSLIIKLSDSILEKLREKARSEGFLLVTDYIRSIIYRELGITYENHERELLENLRKLARGEIPQALIEKIVERVKPSTGVTTEDIEKVVVRVERRIMDIINPFTSKIDELARRVSELQERLEELENVLKGKESEVRTIRPYPQPLEERHAVSAPHKKTAIARLKEQGAVYESELGWLRDADAFFEKLRREGAVLLSVGDERIAVDRDFWSRFLYKLSEIHSPNEDEIRVLLKRQEYKLFKKLKEKGYVFFDASEGRWRILEAK